MTVEISFLALAQKEMLSQNKLMKKEVVSELDQGLKGNCIIGGSKTYFQCRRHGSRWKENRDKWLQGTEVRKGFIRIYKGRGRTLVEKMSSKWKERLVCISLSNGEMRQQL